MKNRIVNNQPQEVTDYLSEEPIDQNAIECINEIFKSPLLHHTTGTIPLLMIELKNYMSSVSSLTGT